MTADMESKKQVIYGRFNSRLFASLLDMVLAGLVIMPIVKITTPLIYYGMDTKKYMEPVMKEALEKHKGMTSIARDVLSHERTMEYFFQQGGIFRFALDQLFQLALFGAIFVTFWVYRNATPGKMLLSLRIADAKTLGVPTKKQYILRFLGAVLSVLPLFLGVFWMLFNKRRQTWHDKIAGTVVIKR